MLDDAAALARSPAIAVDLVRAVLEAGPTELERGRAYELLSRAAPQLPLLAAVEAWLVLSDDAWHAGRPVTADEAAREAAGLAEAAGDRRALGLTHLSRARQLAARSRYQEALAEADVALGHVKERERDLETRVQLLMGAVASHMLSPEAPRRVRRAVLLATDLGDDALLTTAQAQLGITLVERGLHGEGRDALMRALAMAQARGDREVEWRAHLYLSMLELDAGRPLAAQKRVASAERTSQGTRSRIARGLILGSTGVVQLVRRHYAAAARALSEAELLLDEAGDRYARVTMLAFLGAAEALAGRAAEARVRFAEADDALKGESETPYPRALLDVLRTTLSPEDALGTLVRVERSAAHEGWADVRVACRIARSASGPQHPTAGEAAPGLSIGHQAVWASLDGGPPIDLRAKPSLRRLLAALVAATEEHPGTHQPALMLARAVWPDAERLPPKLLLGRLHVSLSTLRRLGLRDAIETAPAGYRIAPHLTVRRIE